MTQYFPLRKFVAPEFVFGEGALKLVGRYASNFGASKVLLVTDPGVVEAGWPDAVIKELHSSGIAFSLFDGVTPDPKDYEVTEGSEFCCHEECDMIIAVGGGSPMDCAKGIGIVCTNHKHILQFEGIDEVAIPGPPIICIPTTAGTSADVSQFAIITDSKRNLKIAIISKTVVPDVSLIDPATTMTMSPELTAATGIDALVHAIEAYVSNASSPITDVNAIQAIKIISKHFVSAIQTPIDLLHRGNMMLASLYAGLAFSNASLGLIHAMAHTLGGGLNLSHGECNALLLEHVMAFNYSAAMERFLDIGEALGADVRKMPEAERESAVINAVVDLKRRIGVNFTLKDLGVTSQMIPTLAKYAIKDPCAATNPKEATIQDIIGIYERAL